MNKLKKGDKVPDFSVTTINKEKITSGSMKGKPYLFIFTRYAGCPICQMHVARVRQMEGDIKKAGGQAILMFRSTDEVLLGQSQALSGFKVMGDPAGTVYSLFGVKGSILGYLAPGTLIATFKALKAGFRHGKFEAGELQMPADFVIDKNGIVTHAHYGNNADDHTPNEVLLEELRKAAQ